MTHPTLFARACAALLLALTALLAGAAEFPAPKEGV